MFDSIFSKLFIFVQKNKFSIFLFLIITLFFSIFRICNVNFKNDISLMLPNNASVKNTLNLFRDSSVGDKVVISFSLNSEKHSINELLTVVNKFTSSIKTPLINSVESGFTSSPLESIKDLTEYAPQLINSEQLKKLEKKITPRSINTALKNGYKRMLIPGGNFSVEMFRLDPLNIYSEILMKLSGAADSMEFKVIPKDNHLFSRDMKHVMVIIETPVSITDSGKSVELLNYINERLKQLPPYINSIVVCGHLHAVSNEKIIKSDIKLTLLISALGFIFLFTIIFRKDFRCFLILLLPVTASLYSVAILSFFIENMSYFIIAMGGVITGIAVDYGIHIYSAVMHNSKKNSSVTFLKKIRNIAKPTVIGCLTTVGVFTAFLFSDIPGYHQLSYFAVMSILLTLLFSIFLLPQILSRNKSVNISLLNKINPQKIISKPIITKIIVSIWSISAIGLIILTANQRMNNDISQFDGSSSEILRNEKEFQKIWGGNDKPAILVTSSDNINELFTVNEQINTELTKEAGIKQYFNFTSIWPSVKTRIKNFKFWKTFWDENKSKFKDLILKESLQYGFNKSAFSPFFKSIDSNIKITEKPVNNAVLKKLYKEFIYRKNNKFYMLSYFPDKIKNINKVEKICNKYSGAFIVSRKAFLNIMSESISNEMIYIAGIAALLIPILTFALLRSIYKSILALLPVLTSVLSIGGFLYLLKLNFNGPVIVAMLIAVGLSIDYGIFMIYHKTEKPSEGTFPAVTLSAVTTIIGAGAVIFAQHPLLFNIGITLVIGICSGYLTAVFVIPAFIQIKKRHEK